MRDSWASNGCSVHSLCGWEPRGGHAPGSARGRFAGVQVPVHLSLPTSSPDTKCFWKAKKTIAVGSAASSEPAATTFH